jgi:hypothetical protein
MSTLEMFIIISVIGWFILLSNMHLEKEIKSLKEDIEFLTDEVKFK